MPPLSVPEHLKSSVQFYDLSKDQDTGQTKLRWVHASAPSHKLLASIAHTVGVSDGTIAIFSRTGQRPAFFRNREASIIVLDELTIDEKSLLLRSQPLFAIMNGKHLVTVSPHESPTIKQIQRELHTGLVSDEEHQFANSLMSRIVGCLIHRNESALRQFELRAEHFASTEASRLPSELSRTCWESVRHSIQIARRSISPTAQVVRALGERASLYGATAKDSLERYESILHGLVSTIDDAESHYHQVARDWDLNQDMGRNLYQARLNILAALLGPAALASSIIEALGAPWSATVKWGLLGASLVVSSVLLVAMRVNGDTIRHTREQLRNRARIML